jgi:hypothetical protein
MEVNDLRETTDCFETIIVKNTKLENKVAC